MLSVKHFHFLIHTQMMFIKRLHHHLLMQAFWLLCLGMADHLCLNLTLKCLRIFLQVVPYIMLSLKISKDHFDPLLQGVTTDIFVETLLMISLTESTLTLITLKRFHMFPALSAKGLGIMLTSAQSIELPLTILLNLVLFLKHLLLIIPPFFQLLMFLCQ